jgi:hypothetical protein
MSHLVRSVNLKTPALSAVVPLLALFTEVFWIYAWLVWISGLAVLAWTAPPVNLFSYLLLAVSVEILSRYSLSQNWTLRRIRLMTLVPGLLLLFLLVRLNLGGGFAIWDSGWAGYAASHLGELIISLVFGFCFVWRGITLSRQPGTFDDHNRSFQIGLAGIVILLIISGITGSRFPGVWSNVGIYAILFFSVGLLTLSLANLDALRIQLQQHQESTVSFHRQWLSLLIMLIIVILGLGIAAAVIISPRTASMIGGALSTLGYWLAEALKYLLYPIIFLAMLIFYGVKYLIGLIPYTQPNEPVTSNGTNVWDQLAQNPSSWQIPASITAILKWGALLLFIVLGIFFLSRLLKRVSRIKTEDDIEELHETFWSWQLFSADLRSLLVWLFKWTKRSSPGSVQNAPPLPVVTGDKETEKLFSVRELYQALLWQGRQLGVPRRRSETPQEYSSIIKARLTAAQTEIDSLTEAYTFARYGEVEPGTAQLKRLNLLWRNLRKKLNDQP